MEMGFPQHWCERALIEIGAEEGGGGEDDGADAAAAISWMLGECLYVFIIFSVAVCLYNIQCSWMLGECLYIFIIFSVAATV